jgi:hypothetical protein
MSRSRQQGPWTELATRAALTGGVGAAASLLMGDSMNRSVSLGPVQLPAPLAVGATVAASSVAADLSRQYILPKLPGNAKFAGVEGTIMGLGVSGVSTALLLDRMGSNQPFLTRAALGAGSYAAGDYVHGKMFQSSRWNLF